MYSRVFVVMQMSKDGYRVPPSDETYKPSDAWSTDVKMVDLQSRVFEAINAANKATTLLQDHATERIDDLTNQLKVAHARLEAEQKNRADLDAQLIVYRSLFEMLRERLLSDKPLVGIASVLRHIHASDAVEQASFFKAATDTSAAAAAPSASKK